MLSAIRSVHKDPAVGEFKGFQPRLFIWNISKFFQGKYKHSLIIQDIWQPKKSI